jgi:transposase
VAHLDETSWRQGAKRAWRWVAVTSFVTVFLVRMSRGGRVARELLGEPFSGILVTERSSAYNGYPGQWRQVCRSHLLRDFRVADAVIEAQNSMHPNASGQPFF